MARIRQKKDNESALSTAEVNKTAQKYGIKCTNSPSYEHKYNELIEIDTKTTAV